MTSSSKTLGDLFGSFRREAFRLETLDDYSKSGNVDAYHTYLAGEPQPEDYNSGWVEELRSHTENGKRVHRVHIVSRPLTDYLRFELGWGYRKNMTGGEEFSILDVTDRLNPLAGVPDFWCFDSESVAVMNYDGAGKYLGSKALEPERVAEFTRYRDTALAHAEPFTEWWAKYGA
ncbi:hypothetical protein GCM10018793_33510 [Streptomyces sulfonofaciens]|uniref:DUF6879 domain-containing protein n=1 Tax=Streptomyces sulfonofaciens TaxID=68272 RepID=A0A919G833_9ACTN|nr:DUF6879 family protein [Streptomyces sulfonofaciens]GHH79862.1 hypothetical protein GCM10018793_33510 [Streptomyces sulfonofaciens]